MSKFKIGTQVKIINRDSRNTTGVEDCDKPMGDVGKTGFVTSYTGNRLTNIVHANQDSSGYLGMFRDEDLELVDKGSQMSEFEKGDLVRIKPFTAGENARDGTYFNPEMKRYIGDSFEHNGSSSNQQYKSWFWSNEWLELVNKRSEGDKKMGRRTFKLLKNLPDVKKGALFQEQCEDGTQPYEMITDKKSYEYSDRSTVEEQPEWFVEVFKVTPEYMTAEELERFEAFKQTKAPKKAGRPKMTVGVTEDIKPQHTSTYWTQEKRDAQSRKVKKYWRDKRAGRR